MMVEWRQILKAATGESGVLVTLVGVQGSSYRREGARLLLTGDGRIVGSVSGGCLEAELMRRAKWLMAKGAMVQHYSTAFDDTDEMPFGLGCGGELDLLLERVDSVEVKQLFDEARHVLAGVPRRIVTWLPAPGLPLRRAIFSVAEDGRTDVLFASEGLAQEEIWWARTSPPPEGGSSRNGQRIFAEALEPPQRLVVFGAGEDARPLVTLGALLGWNVVVADGRGQLARAERFPEAEQVLALATDGALRLQANDAVVVMTHSYEQDRLALQQALPIGPKYLGLLGARHRSSLLVSEAAERLGWSVAQCCERLYAPVGLDLGGDGPEAIALAIVAEIQACVQGRAGLRRRLQAEEVAEQLSRGGRQLYLQAQCAMGAA